MSIPEMDMNPEIARKLLEVGEEFRIEGPFFSYEEIKMGNVNHTYKVNYIRDDGTGMAKIKSFLVQRVNTYAFQHPIELMQNIDRVTEHIREKCPNTKSLHFHHTKHGVNYLMDNDGFWRLSNYVPSVTFDTCDDLNVVRSAGEAFGDFQLMLADFDANSLFYTIPNFHNTRKRYEKLKEDMAADPCNRVAEVREELDWLLSVEDEACRLTDLFEKGELPLRVTHNDTKINNVLFDEKTHEALVVIDLDTVMPGLVGNYVPSVTFDTCDDLNVVRSAGEAFGDFQLMLADFDANSLFYTIPNFHNTRKRYEKLKEDMAADPCNRVAEVREELDWLLSVEDEACRLTDLFEKGELPLRVTHNDTKINNVLFDEKTHEALVVIDLDTVMPGLVGHDFGDAIRFAANFVEEDCDYPEKAGVNLNIFWAFAEGFLKKTAASLTKTEVDTLALSCFALTCELATRFLADYIVGDKYFKVKKPQHNLVRTRCQVALAKDMLNKMDAMNAIVQDCARRYKETENA